MKKVINCIAILSIIIAVSSCGSTKEVDPVSMLTDKTWQLSKINGNDINAAAYREVPYIKFSVDNKVMGKGGCNNFSGSYNLNDEGGISISQIISTKMYCDGVNENDFFMTLEKANNTKIDADKLVLMKGVDQVMVFVPKNEQ